MKKSKKMEREWHEFNRFYRKPQHLRNLTFQEYSDYIYGKGLPDCKPKIEIKPLKPRDVPDWAFNPNVIPSVKPAPDYVPTVKDEEYKKEVAKNYTVSISYNKGGYMVIPNSEIECIGK